MVRRWQLSFWRLLTRIHDRLHAARDELWRDYKPLIYDAADFEWTTVSGDNVTYTLPGNHNFGGGIIGL